MLKEPVKVGGRYKQRNGEVVRVTAIRNGLFPVTAEVRGTGQIRTYGLKGAHMADRQSDYDLVVEVC